MNIDLKSFFYGFLISILLILAISQIVQPVHASGSGGFEWVKWQLMNDPDNPSSRAFSLFVVRETSSGKKFVLCNGASIAPLD